MADAKRDLIAYLANCEDEIVYAALTLQTHHGISVAAPLGMENKDIEALLREGADWIGSRNGDHPKP